MLGINFSLFSSVISIRAATFAQILYGVKKLEGLHNKLGRINYFSMGVSLLDPFLVVIYAIIMSSSHAVTYWGFVTKQNVVVNVINTGIIAFLHILAKRVNVELAQYKQVMNELLMLQLFVSWVGTIIEEVAINTGAVLPLWIWFCLYNSQYVVPYTTHIHITHTYTLTS